MLQTLALLPVFLSLTSALDNGLALEPQMGWNSWNTFACNISEEIILGAAQALKDYGLDQYGYTYVNIDDCWQKPEREANGTIQPNPDKFPLGMRDVADKIHAMGLKIGIYSDAGLHTCGYYPGSRGYETQDATSYAEWGIDYLKYDNCFNQGEYGVPQISANRYAAMRDALNATGRPILYNLCSWGEDSVWNWGQQVANAWRMSGDIIDNWDKYDDRCPCQNSIEPCPLAGYHCSVMNILEKAAGLGQKARQGGWNDLDSLVVGRPGLTYDEQVAHFSLWALVKSPLVLGNDIRNMTDETLSIIKNRDVIAINQDKEHNAGMRKWKQTDSAGGSTQLWKANLENNTYAMAILNATPNQKDITVSLADFFNDEGAEYYNMAWDALDLWQNSTQVASVQPGSNLTVSVNTHAVKLYKLVASSTNSTSLGNVNQRRRVLLEFI